jgi:6-phosphogluconolactonase
MSRELHVFADPQAVAGAAASALVTRALDAIAARGRFTVALSGGTTPLRLYSTLADRMQAGAPGMNAVAWDQVHVFWGDERAVPFGHPDSNFHAARSGFLAWVPVPETNIHRIQTELDPSEAAATYEETLRRCFGLGPGGLPVLDLIYLGLGSDLHTASLFPDSPALDERERLVAATWVPRKKTHRITLTPPVINRARSVVFLVTGENKAMALRTVLETEPDPRRCPAQVVRPADGELIWMVDEAAASRLSPATLQEWR